MQGAGCCGSYPLRTVVISNLVSLLIYGIGAYILYLFSPILAIIYIICLFLLELRLLSGHCTDCYYYGKTCAFGKGYLSSLIFSKGVPERFSQKKVSLLDIVPDFLVFIIPVLVGVVLLVWEFSWITLGLIISLILLGFFGNALVRGQLACRYCYQKEIGCPAEQMFNKAKKG